MIITNTLIKKHEKQSNLGVKKRIWAIMREDDELRSILVKFR